MLRHGEVKYDLSAKKHGMIDALRFFPLQSDGVELLLRNAERAERHRSNLYAQTRGHVAVHCKCLRPELETFHAPCASPGLRSSGKVGPVVGITLTSSYQERCRSAEDLVSLQRIFDLHLWLSSERALISAYSFRLWPVSSSSSLWRLLSIVVWSKSFTAFWRTGEACDCSEAITVSFLPF